MSERQTVNIRISDLEVDAEIGIDAEEQGRAQRLLVSVCLEKGMPAGDEIQQTVDYAAVAEAVRRQFLQKSNLLETAAAQTARALKNEFGALRVKVEICKPYAAEKLSAAEVCVEFATVNEPL